MRSIAERKLVFLDREMYRQTYPAAIVRCKIMVNEKVREVLRYSLNNEQNNRG